MRWMAVLVVGMTACREPASGPFEASTSGPVWDTDVFGSSSSGGEQPNDDDSAGPLFDVPPFDPGPPERAEPPPPPVHGGTLRLSRDGARMFAADAARDLVHVIEVEGRGVLTTIDRPGCVPGRLAETSEGRLMFLCRGSGTVTTVDPKTGDVLSEVDVCVNPRGLAVDADDSVWVACAEGTVVEVRDDRVAADLEVGVELRDLVDAGPPVRVSTFRKPSVLTLDPDGSVVTTETPPLTGLIDGAETIPLQPGETPEDNVVGPLVPNVARRTVATPSGGWAMLHQAAHSSEEGVIQSVGWGSTAGCVGSQNAAASWFEPSTGELESVVFPGMGVVFDAAFDIEGGRIALVGGLRGRWGIVLHELDPAGAFNAGPSCFLLGERDLPNMPTSVAFDSDGLPWVLVQEPSELLVLEEPGSAFSIPLSDRSVADSGHELFHRAANNSVACVSCHPEGRDDGLMWILDGESLRRSMSLARRLEGSAPFHWQGEFETFAELDTEVRVHTMGGLAYSEAWVAALERWVFSIPPMTPDDTQDSALVESGARRFEELGCATCHLPPRYDSRTNVTLEGVGTLQVPPLLGVRYGAPYMHDGRVPSLDAAIDDMLEHTPARAELTGEGRAELLAFLRSL